MPHPDYILDRDLSAALARTGACVYHLGIWYQSGNSREAVSALRMAATRALRVVGEDSLSPQEREGVGRLLADLAALR